MSAFYRITDSSFLSSSSSSSNPTMTGLGVIVSLTQQNGLLASVVPPSSSFSGVPSSSTFATAAGCYVCFDLTHFGDQAVQDLTSVLRLGFVLKYQISTSTAFPCMDEFGRIVAMFVAPASFEMIKRTPLYNSTHLLSSLDAPLSATNQDGENFALLNDRSQNRSNQNSKCSYNVDCEIKALHFLLNIFQQIGNLTCPLHTIHCLTSNCGDHELYNYVGTSSYKRRQFIEKRNHIFSIGPDETVHLVPGALHLVVVALAKEVLKRGGATLLQELFDAYLMWPDVPLESRELIGESKQRFVRFLDAFPFIFAVFPSKVFVSVRRRLPDHVDYPAFLTQCFGDQEGSPDWDGNGLFRHRTSASSTLLKNRDCPKVPPTPSSLPVVNGTKDALPYLVHTGTPHCSREYSHTDGLASMWTQNSEQQWLMSQQQILGQQLVQQHSVPLTSYHSNRNSRGDGSSSSLSVISCISETFQAPFVNNNFTPAPNNYSYPAQVCHQLFQYGSSNATNAHQMAVTAPVDSGTPGFWKSYELCTEDLVKNFSSYVKLNQSNDDVITIPCSSSPPSPPSASSSGPDTAGLIPGSTATTCLSSTTSTQSTQTAPDAHCHFMFCLRCGSTDIQLGPGSGLPLASSKPSTADFECQFDNT